MADIKHLLTLFVSSFQETNQAPRILSNAILNQQTD